MAEESVERASLTCPVCLDLLTTPVTIPCGHSFCMICIQNSWRQMHDTFPCPQCRKRFMSRPELNKNIMLANLVEQIIKSTPSSDLHAGPLDVSCDVCTGKKLKAVKSCLHCVISFCKNHLQPHHDVPMLKKHQLVAPCHTLQENICHEHKEVKKMFCRSDQQPICRVCCWSKHKGHTIVSSVDERAQRQASLEVDVDLLKNRVVLKEADQRRLDEKNQYSNQSAKSAELQCTNTFVEIRDVLKNIEIELHQHIISQQRSEIHQNNSLQNKLRQEVLDLTKSISDLEALSNTQEDNHFLLLYPTPPSPPKAAADTQTTSSAAQQPTQASSSQSAAQQPTQASSSQSAAQQPTQASSSQSAAQQPTQASSSESAAQQPTDAQEDIDPTSVLERPPMDFDYVIRFLQAFREKFPVSLNEFKLPEPEILLPAPEPLTRKDLLCYSRAIALDQSTAHRQMLASNNDRAVSLTSHCEDNPRKFMQIFSKYGMTGRSYWEVDVSKATYVIIAVSYKDIEGEVSATQWEFGKNNKSWALKCDNRKYSISFDSVTSEVFGPVRPVIGVYLDHKAGNLSFYSVFQGSATLLHKVQTSFTQPLYAGIGLKNLWETVCFRKLKCGKK